MIKSTRVVKTIIITKYDIFCVIISYYLLFIYA